MEAAPVAAPQLQRWAMHQLPVSSQLLEYVPGRDDLLQAPTLAAGLDAHDASSGEHFLFTAAVPREVFTLMQPFVLRYRKDGPCSCLGIERLQEAAHIMETSCARVYSAVSARQ